MISSTPASTRSSSQAQLERIRPLPSQLPGRAYGSPFWFTYASNLFLTTGNAVLFRYGDFIEIGGGSELTLGLIVGVGMIGSILMRGVQGVGVDVYGARKIWLLSSIGFVLACLGHLAVHHASNPVVFGLRILYQTSVAGIFGASIAFISRRAPVYRIAEVVGTLGTSGFLGMILGALLVDSLYGPGLPTSAGVARMFMAASALGVLSGVFAWFATRDDGIPARRRYVPVLWLVKKYNPGNILLVSVVMGFGLGLAGTFVRPYAASLHISGIGTFFSVYAITAFATRLSIRKLPERIGIRRMVLLGIACLAIDMLLYLPVRTEWQFIPPAMMIGVAHAILFPAVIAGGSAAFPDRYRGLGTALLLAMFDIGMFIGSPAIGSMLRIADFAGMAKYPTMFATLALFFTGVGLWYLMAGSQQDANGEKETAMALFIDQSDALPAPATSRN